ncbi:MAG: hypothetical protein ABDH49_03985 [Candidatus Hydrothermales bacterium]
MRLREIPIGSDYYFEFPFLFKRKNKIFSFWKGFLKKIKLFFSGRDALRFLLSEIGDKYFFLLPSYTCYEVIRPFEEFNLNFDFYRINFKPEPEIDFDDLEKLASKRKNPIVLIIEYFGFPQNYQLHIPFILDISHSLLTFKKRKFKINPTYIFGSLRKILPIPDGGILLYNDKISGKTRSYNKIYFTLKLASSLIKNIHYLIPGKTQFLLPFSYFQLDKRFENYLSYKRVPERISSISKFMLKSIPYNFLIKRRRENFLYFLKTLSFDEIKPLYSSLPSAVCPLNFPFFTNSKKKIKEILIKNRIFPPTIWDYVPPIINKEKFPEIHTIPERILSLPIDHRYNIKHMDKIKKTLEKCLK